MNQSPYYLRARYYDPLTGRFLTRDPWPANTLDAQSLNGYAYVYDDPVRYTDLYGYFLGIPNPESRTPYTRFKGWLMQLVSSAGG